MSERTFIIATGTIILIFWLIGLILLYLRTEIGNWMTWVFIVAMGIAEISHLFFPFIDTGHFGYFSGLYTSVLLIAAGWYLGLRLYRASQGPCRVSKFKRSFLWVLKNTLNRVTIRAARSGHSIFSLVRHIGQKTGNVYETPIIVARVPYGFIVELTYGSDVNWYRNVVAAGRCVIVFKAEEYEIDGIEPYPVDAGRRAFGFPGTFVLRILRRHEFRLFHEAAEDPPPGSG